MTGLFGQTIVEPLRAKQLPLFHEPNPAPDPGPPEFPKFDEADTPPFESVEPEEIEVDPARDVARAREAILRHNPHPGMPVINAYYGPRSAQARAEVITSLDVIGLGGVGYATICTKSDKRAQWGNWFNRIVEALKIDRAGKCIAEIEHEIHDICKETL